MVPLLTKLAVERKSQFEHVILLGNYELAYALGAVSKGYGLEKKSQFENVVLLKEEVLAKLGDWSPDDIRLSRMLRVIKEMDSCTTDMDEQVYEVYAMAYMD